MNPKGRKSQIQDTIYIPVFLFAASVMAVIMYHILKTIGENDSIGIAQYLPAIKSAALLFDWLIPLAFVLLAIFIIFLAFIVPASPVAAPFAILFTLFISWISSWISNAYILIAESQALITSANDFGVTYFFMGKLPLWTALLGFIVTIVLIGKPQNGQQGGYYG
jgi:hypothetical protein